MKKRQEKQRKTASLWLDQESLYLGLPMADGQFLTVHQQQWNPEGLDIQSLEANQKLTAALSGLAKQYSLQRMGLRLCLDDGLCVTRVVTGDKESVGREIEAIRTRSQLYLSLGLGEKTDGWTKSSHRRSKRVCVSIDRQFEDDPINP